MNAVECIRNLESAGVEVVSGSDDEIYCLCPFHEDNHTSMSVNWEKGQWICFAGCGAGRLKTLWSRLNYTPEESDDIELRLSLDDKPEVNSMKTEVISERLLAYVEKRVSKMRGSGWYFQLDSIVDVFNIRKARVGSYRGEIYTEFETLVFDSRRLDGSVVGYVTQCPDHKAICIGNAKKACFGLYETWKVSGSPIVIVEGVFDALCVYLCGYRVAALFGCTMSKRQMFQVLAASDNVIVFMDSDAPGRRGTKKVVEMLLAESVNPRVVDWGQETKKDPADLTHGEIHSYLKSAGYADTELSLDC